MPPKADLTAVCLAGEQRTFLEPVVQHAFAHKLHRAGYEYFVVTDQPRPLPERLQIAPVREWIAEGLVGRITGHGTTAGCAPNTCNSHRFLYPAMERLAHCYTAIQREEGRRSMRYDYLLRLRPDHLILRRQPSVSRAFGEQLARGKLLLWDDQIAVARRGDAATVLLTPRLVYHSCIDEAQWRQACGRYLQGPGEFRRDFRRCLTSGEVPCPAMHLITVFSRGEYEEHPWAARTWDKGIEGPAGGADFCLKRAEWVNESLTSRCKVEPGCLSC